MIEKKQIHCFLDCLSAALEEDGRFDSRPVYFGAWSAPFSVTEQGISYFSESIGLRESIEQFARFYGSPSASPFSFWFDSAQSKAENFKRMEQQVDNKVPHFTVIILVDLYHLPHSAFSYQLKHRPHVLIVDHCNGADFYLCDPHLGWSGYVSRELLYQAFCCDNFYMGITLSTKDLHAPAASEISQYFSTEFNLSQSRLVSVVDGLLGEMAEAKPGYTVQQLHMHAEQVDVIAKRMAAYPFAYAYFANIGDELLKDEFTRLSAELAKGWESFLLAMIRLGILQKQSLLLSVRDKLNRLGQLECMLKKEIWDRFVQWEKAD